MSSSSLIDIPTSVDHANSPNTSIENEPQQRQDTETLESLYINNEEAGIHENFTKSKIILSIFVLIIVTLVIIDFSTNRYIEQFFTSVLEWIEANPIPGFIVSIIIYFVSTILFIPVSILALGSAFVFAKEFGLVMGVLLTTIAVYIGASTGAMISFLLGRYLLRQPVHKMAAKHTTLKALDSALKRKGFRIMALLHLSPIIPFGALNYIAGITAVSFWAYYFSLFSILPGTIFYSFVGASAGSLADSSKDAEAYELIGIGIGLVLAIMGLMVISYYTRLELAKVKVSLFMCFTFEGLTCGLIGTAKF